jgi:hypothetical protein
MLGPDSHDCFFIYRHYTTHYLCWWYIHISAVNCSNLGLPLCRSINWTNNKEGFYTALFSYFYLNLLTLKLISFI